MAKDVGIKDPTNNRVYVTWNSQVGGYFWCWHLPDYEPMSEGPFKTEEIARKAGEHSMEFIRIANSIVEK